MKICYRCYVSGKVQGVFFRVSTRQQAASLGVTGYARNLADHRVEVLMCGTKEALDSLRNWLWTGPPAAGVDGVECEQLAYRDFEKFSLG